MQVSLCGLPMENMDWTGIFDTWKLTQTHRALPLEVFFFFFFFWVGFESEGQHANAKAHEAIDHMASF